MAPGGTQPFALKFGYDLPLASPTSVVEPPWASKISSWPNETLDRFAKHKNISFAARRMFRRDFFLIYFRPFIFKPNVPSVLRILTAFALDAVLHLHCILVGTTQMRVS